jgi:hypothetical protein
MAKAKADIRSLARSHTETAIKVLAGIMQQETAQAAARVAAAQALLDRGWGKAPQTMSGEDGEGPAELVIRWLTAQPK